MPSSPLLTPLRARWAAPLAVAAGIAGAYAFPAVGIWPLAFVSVAGLSVAVHRRRARGGAWLGLLYGLGLFVPLLHWTGIYVGPVPWLLLAVAEACFCAGLGAVLALVQRLPVWPVWAGAAWVLEEFARDRVPFGGFPWGRLAFSQADSPARWFAALGGAPLVSFAVGFGGACLAVAVLRLRAVSGRWVRVRTLVPVVAGLAGLVVVPLGGLALSVPLRPAPGGDGHTAVVALVQGNVPRQGLVMESRARQVLEDHVTETERLIAEVRAGTVPRPDLVLWPEDASDVDPLTDPVAHAQIDQLVGQLGVPLLVGAILNGPGPTHRRNVGILWSPTTGPGQMYVKRHPVPFGEYIPMRSIAKWFSSDVGLVRRDMVAGHGNGLMAGGPFPFGDVICFEIAYDSLVRSSVLAGAQVLVVQTNNATFGHTSETYQQLAMAQLRAVETDREVLQVSTTGVSAVIAPDGTLSQRSHRLFTPDLLVARVPLRTSQTLAIRLGPAPEYGLSALAVAAALWSLLPYLRERARTRRRARRVAEADPPTPEKVTM